MFATETEEPAKTRSSLEPDTPRPSNPATIRCKPHPPDHSARTPHASEGTAWVRDSVSEVRSAETAEKVWWYRSRIAYARTEIAPGRTARAAPAASWRMSVSLTWRGVPLSRDSVK